MRANKKIINKIMMMILTGGILAGTTGELKTFARVPKGLSNLKSNFDENRGKNPRATKQDKKEKKRGKKILIAEELKNIREAVEKICGKIENEEEVSEEEIKEVNKTIVGNGVNRVIKLSNIKVKETEREKNIVIENDGIVKYNLEGRREMRIRKILKYVNGRKINEEIEGINKRIIYINKKIQEKGLGTGIDRKLGNIKKIVEMMREKIENGEEVDADEIEEVNKMIVDTGVNNVINIDNKKIEENERKYNIVVENENIFKYNKKNMKKTHICLIKKYVDGREINGEIGKINEKIEKINTKIQGGEIRIIEEEINGFDQMEMDKNDLNEDDSDEYIEELNVINNTDEIEEIEIEIDEEEMRAKYWIDNFLEQ